MADTQDFLQAQEIYNKILYFGAETLDGSWRMQVIGDELLVQLRVDGTWTDIAGFVKP